MTAAELIADLAARIGLPDLALNDEGACRIILDNAYHVNLEAVDDGRRIVTTCAVAAVPADADPAFFRGLLAGSHLAVTDGEALGIDAASGEVVLNRSDRVAWLDGEALAALFEDFARRAVRWRTAIEGYTPGNGGGGSGGGEAAGDTTTSADPDAAHEPQPGMIRA